MPLARKRSSTPPRFNANLNEARGQFADRLS